MAVGDTTAPEWKTIPDFVTGLPLRQLTDYKGNSHHVYFTNPAWYDGGRKMLFGSDRANRTNLFSIDLESGAITQLTDLEPVGPPRETQFLTVCVNPSGNEAYFWYNREVRAIDLETFEQRTLWTLPEGFRRSMINCTADGRYVCAGIVEDLSNHFRVDTMRGYIGFREIFHARPESRIMCVATDGSGADCVRSEKCWIGHVNTSPTRANLLTFCHEGPCDLVDNRRCRSSIRFRRRTVSATGRRFFSTRPSSSKAATGHEGHEG